MNTDTKQLSQINIAGTRLGKAADAINALDREQACNEECRRIAIYRVLDAEGVTNDIVDQALAIEARLEALGDLSRSALMSMYLASPVRSRSALLEATATAPLNFENGTFHFEVDLYFALLLSVSRSMAGGDASYALH